MNRLPSISKIIEFGRSDASKQALRKWRGRVGESKVRSIRNRGISLHKLVEYYFDDVLLDPEGTGNPYFNSLLPSLEYFKDEFITSEESFYREDLGYCGRADLIASNTLIELKTIKYLDNVKSYKYYEYGLQLGALYYAFKDKYDLHRAIVLIVSPEGVEKYAPDVMSYYYKFRELLNKYRQ